MLAATFTDMFKIKFPCFVQPKLDGIRCIILNGTAYTRQMKPIPNLHIQKILSSKENGLDGEIMLKNRAATFQDIQSAVMTEAGEPEFVYHIFDLISDEMYYQRLQKLIHMDNSVPTYFCKNFESLIKNEEWFIKSGYEGAMIRSPHGLYKHGRSTENEGYLLKLKRFLDAEATIIGVEELIHKNGTKSNLLGSLVTKDFKVGTGFTMEQRADLWTRKNEIIDMTFTYKYQELSKYGIPRFPVFLHFRNLQDL